MSAQITRADLTKTFQAGHQIEDEIMAQLRERELDEDSPSWLVLPALKQLSCPHWCTSGAWRDMLDRCAEWASAHGSLTVWRAARTMKHLPFQRWLEQRRRKLDAKDEAKYLFVDMDMLGDADQ